MLLVDCRDAGRDITCVCACLYLVSLDLVVVVRVVEARRDEDQNDGQEETEASPHITNGLPLLRATIRETTLVLGLAVRVRHEHSFHVESGYKRR